MPDFYIGGSEAAASVGLDPYRSRVALWAEKTGLAEPRETGEAALWGTLLEPVIAAQVEARGYVTMPAPADGIASEEFPWMRGHLDGFVSVNGANNGGEAPVADEPRDVSRASGSPYSSRGVLEVKTCGPWIKGWDNNQAPAAYIAQTHHYMQLTGLEWALLACLVGGQRLELRRIERDDDFLALLLEAEVEFVDLCERGVPPAPDGSPATDDVLTKLYPRAHAGTVVELTATDMRTVGELRALKEAAKETERQVKEREQLVKTRLGDNELGVYEGVQVVSYKNVVQERKAVEARRVEYRRLLV